MLPTFPGFATPTEKVSNAMATVIVSTVTSVPLVLLVWDLATHRRRHGIATKDRLAGPARTPTS